MGIVEERPRPVHMGHLQLLERARKCPAPGKMQRSDGERELSILAHSPFVPFAELLNDLVPPIFLNNIQPAPEASISGAIFSTSKQVIIPAGLLDPKSFNLQHIVLNQPPLMAVAHEYDPFMRSVMQQCYERGFTVNTSDAGADISPTSSQPSNHPSTQQMTVAESPTPPLATPSKIKLKGAIGENDAGELLRRLVHEDTFVSPLSFDCIDDIGSLARLIRLCVSGSLSSESIATLRDLVPQLSAYIGDYMDYLNDTSSEVEPCKSVYCLCLLALLNIMRTALDETPKDFNSFDQVIALQQHICSRSANNGEAEQITALTIESYIALLRRFAIQDAEIASYSSHLLELYFSDTASQPVKTASCFALAQLFASYPDLRSYIVDQALTHATSSEAHSVQQSAIVLFVSSLQALAAREEAADQPAGKTAVIAAQLASILDYLWKGEGTELPKGVAMYAVWMDELLFLVPSCKWPIAAFILNHSIVQMFRVLLKDEHGRTSTLLKLRFLDMLTTVANTLASLESVVEGRSQSRCLWAQLDQNWWHAPLLNETATVRNLSPFFAVAPETLSVDTLFVNNMLSSGPLSKVPERVTGLLVKLIASEVVQIRSKAIKNLYSLASSSSGSPENYSILRRSILTKASDPSISVRDAVLDFISKLIFTPSRREDARELIESVLLRIKDCGVSVRKRALKIVGELLVKGLVSGDLRVSCIATLLTRLPEEEDDAVLDMTYKTLKEQWVLPLLSVDFKNGSAISQRPAIAGFTREIVDIIGQLHMSSNCLQQFLTRLLSDTTTREECVPLFASIVDVLLESLLKALETDESDVLKCTLESIAIFSAANNQALEGHLSLLQTLIRSDDSEIALLSMKLLATALDEASLTKLKQMKDLERDLQSIIYRGSEVAVRLAIESLYHYINNCSHQYHVLSSLWQMFTDFLKAKMPECEAGAEPEDDIHSGADVIPHVCRALIAAGVLCAQSSLHREREFGMRDFHTTGQVKTLLNLIFFYAKLQVSVVRACSIQALGTLLLACPQIVTTHVAVRVFVTDALRDTDDSCRHKMLAVFESIVASFSDGEQSPSDGTSNLQSLLAVESKEAFYCALLQENLTAICDCVIDTGSMEIQALALKICAASAILGLISPQSILPFVVVGMSSRHQPLRDYSRSSFDRIMTRFPALLPRDLLHIGRLIYVQQQHTHAIIDGFQSVDAHSGGISQLAYYYACARGKKGRGTDLLAPVFSHLERLLVDSHAMAADSVAFIPFIVGLVATLPLSTMDEVAYLLQRIQSLFSLASDAVESAVSDGDDDAMMTQWALVSSLNYAASYLVQSYPAVAGASLETHADATSSVRREKPCTRVPVRFAFPAETCATEAPSRAQILTRIADLAVVPALQQEPKGRPPLRRLSRSSSVDEDIGNFLVDDDSLSSDSSSSSDFEDFLQDYNATTARTRAKRASATDKDKRGEGNSGKKLKKKASK